MRKGTALEGREKAAPEGDILDLQAERPNDSIVCK